MSNKIRNTLSQRKIIKVLSLDGGGIRGLIPALILQEIEKKLKTKKSLSQCFDLMSGTSTGGIIVLLLNTPTLQGKPKYNASDVVSLYQTLGSTVFNQSWGQYLKSLNGWLSEKYSSDNLVKSLHHFFGNCRLKESLTNIIIPSYDISQDDNVFFKSDKARKEKGRDFYFRDIAQATSAAPTFFKPAHIQNVDKTKTFALVDGGVAVNNPTMSACVQALKLFGKDQDFLVVSIGTGTNNPVAPGKLSFQGKKIKSGGKIEWAPDIVSVLMNATNEVVDYQMREIFPDGGRLRKYFRFQTLLDAHHTAFDNASAQNILALENYARDLIHKNQNELTELARLLDE
ncbi:MAG: patatin [Alphaproteobacteria bacterium]|nr:patatin [Alphaproteobacteria bacterium]